MRPAARPSGLAGALAVAWLSLATWAGLGVLVVVWGYRETVRYEDQGIPLTLIAGALGFLVIEIVVVAGALATARMRDRPRWRGVAMALHSTLVAFSAVAWAVTERSGWTATLLLAALNVVSVAGAASVVVFGRSTNKVAT